MSCKMTIEQICGAVESPLFDRKSARIDAKALAVHLIAFANADGGVIAVGVEDDGTITGIDSYAENINELLRAPFDFCKPSVRVETERLSCTNRNGKADHILLIEVLQSSDLHANQADEVFFRVGDKSKKLNFEERLQLMYAKGRGILKTRRFPMQGWTTLTSALSGSLLQGSAIGKARRNTSGRTRNFSPKEAEKRKSARRPCCCSAKIRSTSFPAPVSASCVTKERRQGSAQG